MKISVIIVSWNVQASLKKCLHAVFATKYRDLDVLVVDNASSDDSVKVASSFSKVTVVKNATNIGFPRAVNQGLRLAIGEYLLVLNPDTILPPDFFTSALAANISGIMGPKLINEHGQVEPSVYHHPSIFTVLHPQYVPASTTPVSVDVVSGACLFFPKAVITKIGPLTEQVFMYYEDIDFCTRAKRAGFQVVYNPTITVTHLHGQSARQTPQTYKYLTESLLYPFHKSKLQSTQRYLTESSIWYNGWFKHVLMTTILWLHQKFTHPT